jgi:hypothetical protein
LSRSRAGAPALAASTVNAFYFNTSLQPVLIKVFDAAAVLTAVANL